jgi:predicted kinase
VTVVQRLVYVSGAPGAGKSTLAGPLAAELGYALLGKDIIKETLHGVLGPPDLDRARSRELGAASMELLWALAARSPQVLIEANFRPYSDYERSRLTALGGVQVEIHCTCPPDLAVARYAARPRHPVHVQTALTLDDMAEYDRPVGIGTLVTVDTTTPVDVPALATQLRFLLLPHLRERRTKTMDRCVHPDVHNGPSSRRAPRWHPTSCCYLQGGGARALTDRGLDVGVGPRRVEVRAGGRGNFRRPSEGAPTANLLRPTRPDVQASL